MDSSYRAGSILLRDAHPLGSDEVVAAKELLKTLELGSAQAMRLLPEVCGPDVWPWLEVVTVERAEEHPPLR